MSDKDLKPTEFKESVKQKEDSQTGQPKSKGRKWLKSHSSDKQRVAHRLTSPAENKDPEGVDPKEPETQVTTSEERDSQKQSATSAAGYHLNMCRWRIGGNTNVSDPELEAALEEFRKNYQPYAEKYQLVRMQNLDWSLQAVDAKGDLTNTAQFFTNQISSILEVTTTKQKISDAKSIGVLGKFLSKLYPLVKTSLQLTGVIAEVDSIKWCLR
jgi:hypothetical protein